MTGAGAECLVYALGGGSGHAVRGALLAQAIERRGTTCAVWVHADRARLARSLHARAIGCARPASAGELRASLERVVGELGARTLVVDTFVEGLCGELADAPLPVPAVALLRLRRADAPRDVARAMRRYGRAIDLEPHLAWLAAGDAEPGGPVARPLVHAAGAPDVLLAAGDGELGPLFARLSRRLRGAGVAAEVAEHDGAGLLDARALSAKVVVGAAGYNLTYELARLGTWHVAVPLRRRFDDQRARAERVARVCSSPEALERIVLALVRGGASRPRSVEVLGHDELAAIVTR